MDTTSLKNEVTNLRTKNSRNLFIKVLCITFILGIVAHAYAFFGPIFSHDSLVVLFAGSGEDLYKISLGRILVPLYRTLSHGSLALPWLIGVLSMLWISLAVYVVARIFQLRSTPLLVLTAGIFSLNVTVTAMTATYIQELDADMCAMLLATISAWLWVQCESGKHWLYIVGGSLSAALSLALYQSYISVTITLIMIYCILQLLNHRSAKSVLIHGLKALVMLATAALLYCGMLKIATAIFHVHLMSDGYNSVTNALTIFNGSIISKIVATYVNFFYSFLKYACQYTGFPKLVPIIVHMGLFVIPGWIVVRVIFSRKYPLTNKLLLILLGLLLPLGMNFSCFLAGGAHSLMHFAFCIPYLLLLLLVYWGTKSIELPKPRVAFSVKLISGILMATILLGNIQASNSICLKKELERETTLTTFTRIADEMAQIDNYVPGSTPVVFCQSGAFKKSPVPFDRYSFITGLSGGLQTTYADSYFNYFKYFLKEPILIADADTIAQMQTMPEVTSMPTYSQKGYVKMLDDVLVVRLN